MDFFFCCCRSCLKGKDSDNNKEYYARLGLDGGSACTQEEIKKAYKAKSLQMHPDKIAQRGGTTTPQTLLEFQKMKDAYDVLSDPIKRRYYDEFGEGGMKMAESAKEMNLSQMLKNFQENKADCALITFLFLIGFVLVLCLPILFCLRVDGDISLMWSFIWFPMWIIDLLLLIAVLITMVVPCFRDLDPEDEQGRPSVLQEVLRGFYTVIQATLFILLQVFVVLKLDGILTWSWIKVFIPWFIYDGAIVGENLMSSFASVGPPNHKELSYSVEDPEEMRMKRIAMDGSYHDSLLSRFNSRRYIVVSTLRIVFAFMLAYKLDNNSSMNWALVFLPVWIYFVLEFFWASTLTAWGIGKISQIDQSKHPSEMDPVELAELKRGADLIARGQLEMCTMWLPVSLAILFVCYLMIGGFSSFFVLIPVFLIIGICMCCVFCTLCCAVSVDVDKMDTHGFDRSKTDMHEPSDSSHSEPRKEYTETDPLLRPRSNARQQSGKEGTYTSAASTMKSQQGSSGHGGNYGPETDWSSLNVRQLKDAVQQAGLSSEAIGFNEKSEYIALLARRYTRTSDPGNPKKVEQDID
jgi:hypothetical protein